MLYRELAPLDVSAWKEIDEKAEEILKTYLSARKVVKVNGPKGLAYNAISEGRLGKSVENGNACHANYNLIPLTETRVEFEIDRWELDNVMRGAKDIELKPMEDALKELALLEDEAVYNGLEEAGIKGLKDFGEDPISFGNSIKDIMSSVLKGVIRLKENYIEGPYSLVVGKKAYEKILSQETGYPVNKRLESLIDGKIILSQEIDDAYLLPYNHDDLELTIGRDFSIGYQNHTDEKIKFFATESFTFRVLDSELVIKFKV